MKLKNYRYLNNINKRYNIGISIINNNQGVKAMLNDIIKPSRIIKSYKIFNRLKSIINKVFENVGYFFIGYKVDIEQNQSDILEAKAKIRILRNTQSHNIDDIIELKKVIDMRINMLEGSMIKSDKKAIYKDSVNLNELLFTTNNKMLNDCSKELISFIIDAKEYEDKVDIKDINNILRKHINLTNERGQDGTK